jgi:hypothetical protein
MHVHLREHPDVEEEELDAGWREFLQHQRTILIGLHNDLTISDDIYNELSSQVDELLGTARITWENINDLNASLWQIFPEPGEAGTKPEIDSDNLD